MARPLRIQYPDAWYHIMNRGRRADLVFVGQKDYELFINVLRESSEIWDLKIAAYCLIPNHYHLLVQTPQGNLSRSMRHIDGVYTQRFNRLRGCDGQLFRGRYKSIVKTVLHEFSTELMCDSIPLARPAITMPLRPTGTSSRTRVGNAWSLSARLG